MLTEDRASFEAHFKNSREEMRNDQLVHAQAELGAGIGDAVAFGRPFISNPDLPYRLEEGVPLAPDDASKWFNQGPEGYIDYPAATRAVSKARNERAPLNPLIF
ncbi:UNVERIFIED_ORG: 2,4-dienoyl-CoA reductase-like NADH-dependent reductase (Old Yellow Enzyme family) [Rhizobium aethiopicum]